MPAVRRGRDFACYCRICVTGRYHQRRQYCEAVADKRVASLRNLFVQYEWQLLRHQSLHRVRVQLYLTIWIFKRPGSGFDWSALNGPMPRLVLTKEAKLFVAERSARYLRMPPWLRSFLLYDSTGT